MALSLVLADLRNKVEQDVFCFCIVLNRLVKVSYCLSICFSWF
jgi:hypothetical protein